MLEVRIDAKAYPSADGEPRLILRDVRFSADAGEVLALLGPSGIGKSTIIRIILGLDHEFTGAIVQPTQRVGVMFQEPLLLPWLSVAENLSLVQVGSVAGPDITHLLEEALLPQVQSVLPSALSLGMARRVSYARALAVDPELLVLDEPFASLDAGLAAALAARVTRRAKERHTLVLLSTHDLDQALAIADRILVLAGAPATLAADLAVATGTRETLLARFSFLAGREDQGGSAPHWSASRPNPCPKA